MKLISIAIALFFFCSTPALSGTIKNNKQGWDAAKVEAEKKLKALQQKVKK